VVYVLDELKITHARGKNEYRYVYTLSVLILAENVLIGVVLYKVPFFVVIPRFTHG